MMMMHKYLILSSCINPSNQEGGNNPEYLKHRKFNAEKCCRGYGRSLKGQKGMVQVIEKVAKAGICYITGV